MSETVHYRGIARKIYTDNGKTVIDKAQDILNTMGVEMDSFYDTPLDFLCEKYSEEYFFHQKTRSLFKISREELDPYEDIIRAKEIDKDVYEYELRYYNGGAGFEECLEEALDKI